MSAVRDPNIQEGKKELEQRIADHNAKLAKTKYKADHEILALSFESLSNNSEVVTKIRQSLKTLYKKHHEFIENIQWRMEASPLDIPFLYLEHELNARDMTTDELLSNLSLSSSQEEILRMAAKKHYFEKRLGFWGHFGNDDITIKYHRDDFEQLVNNWLGYFELFFENRLLKNEMVLKHNSDLLAKEKAQKEAADEKVKKDAEAKTDANEQAKQDAKAKADADEQVKQDAEAKAKTDADEQAKQDAEAKAKTDADEQAKQDAEAKAKTDADEQAKQNAEAKAKTDADEQVKKDAEAKTAAEVTLKEAADKEQAKNVKAPTLSCSAKDLLDKLEEALNKHGYDKKSKIYLAAKNVIDTGREVALQIQKPRFYRSQKADLQNNASLAESLTLALQVIQFPKDKTAIDKLKNNASKSALGKSSAGKKFVGALLLLGSLALLALGVAAMPVLPVGLGCIAAGTVLGASAMAFFHHSREKSLAKSLRGLTSVKDEPATKRVKI